MSRIFSPFLLIFFLTACEAIPIVISGGYALYDTIKPSNFDNQEYSALVRLNILSESHQCQPEKNQKLLQLSTFLDRYTDYRVAKDVRETYDELHLLVKELVERENPSETYCKLKFENIYDVTDKMLKIYSER